MCTSVAITSENLLFGRNMDIEGSFGEGVVVTPRSFPLRFRLTEPSLSHYAMIGTAVVVENEPLYADAMNERGLCAAGLNFPDLAVYQTVGETKKTQIAPFELIPWVLGNCATVSEAKQLLEKTTVVSVPFSDALPLTPLHWHFADRHGSIAVEPMKDGLFVYDDPVGVLANKPSFPEQLEQLEPYGSLTNLSVLGGKGLPGDYTSQSRFVKTAVMKNWLVMEGEQSAQVDALFSLLESVAPPKGCVLNSEGRAHYTTYSCCMDAEEGSYYLRRRGELCVLRFCPTEEMLVGSELSFMNEK